MKFRMQRIGSRHKAEYAIITEVFRTKTYSEACAALKILQEEDQKLASTATTAK